MTKEKFLSFEGVKQSGVINMFDARTGCEISGLDRDEWMDICSNYAEYADKWLDGE